MYIGIHIVYTFASKLRQFHQGMELYVEDEENRKKTVRLFDKIGGMIKLHLGSDENDSLQ